MNKFLAAAVLIAPLLSWSQTSYKVKPGDTILKIADQTLGNKDRKNPRRYQVAQEIRKLNPGIKNPNALEPGQTILIPGQAQAEAREEKEQPIAEPMKAPEHSTPVAPVVPNEPVKAAEPVVEVKQPHVESLPPVEAAKPAEPEHAAVSHEGGHSNFFFIQPRYQVLEISAKDTATKTKASMKSKSSMGLDLQYGVILNEQFHLLFQAGATQTQFQDIEGPTGAAVNHTWETLKYFAAGIAYESTSYLHTDLLLMQTERTVLLPTILPDYELHAIAVPAAELNISLDFYTGDSHLFGFSAIGEYLTKVEKDGIEYKEAFEPFGALYWKSKFGHDHLNYKATLTYKHGHQETSVSEQSEDMTSLGLGIYF
jgi:hypothetical protein